jgi:hypothetical protein
LLGVPAAKAARRKRTKQHCPLKSTIAAHKAPNSVRYSASRAHVERRTLVTPARRRARISAAFDDLKRATTRRLTGHGVWVMRLVVTSALSAKWRQWATLRPAVGTAAAPARRATRLARKGTKTSSRQASIATRSASSGAR